MEGTVKSLLVTHISPPISLGDELLEVMPVRGPEGQFKSGFVAAKQQPNGMGCEDVWITRGMG